MMHARSTLDWLQSNNISRCWFLPALWSACK